MIGQELTLKDGTEYLVKNIRKKEMKKIAKASGLRKTINDYIAVEQETVATTDSGLFIPDNDPNAEYHTGYIRIKGDQKDIKEGDRVIYKHYRNLKYTVPTKGTQYELIKYEDIIGIL
jgi:co-chaperonin GroES (HSP10)